MTNQSAHPFRTLIPLFLSTSAALSPGAGTLCAGGQPITADIWVNRVQPGTAPHDELYFHTEDHGDVNFDINLGFMHIHGTRDYIGPTYIMHVRDEAPKEDEFYQEGEGWVSPNVARNGVILQGYGIDGLGLDETVGENVTLFAKNNLQFCSETDPITKEVTWFYREVPNTPKHGSMSKER